MLLLVGAAAILFWVLKPSDVARPVITPPVIEQEDSGVEQSGLISDDTAGLILDEEDAGGPKVDAGRRVRIVYVNSDGDVSWNCAGTIPPGDAARVITQSQVRACYERRLKQNQLLQGTMSLSMKIDVSGRVVGTKIGGTLRDNETYACVRQVAATWRFPQPRGGCAVVSQPFSFSPRR